MGGALLCVLLLFFVFRDVLHHFKTMGLMNAASMNSFDDLKFHDWEKYPDVVLKVLNNKYK